MILQDLMQKREEHEDDESDDASPKTFQGLLRKESMTQRFNFGTKFRYEDEI